MTAAELEMDVSTAAPAGRDAHRRRSDSVLTHFTARMADAAERPGGLGQAMLGVTGFITVVTAPALGLSELAWVALAAVSTAMSVLILLSMRVDWLRHGPRALLVFPAAVLLALFVLGLAQPVTFAPLTGLLTFVFAFLGVTQPAGTSAKVMPVAGAVYLVVNGQHTAPILIRLLVATLVWTFLGELLAHMTARRRILTDALHRTASRDPLTGADTRRVWDTRLARAQPGTTIVICDLDHFKIINDTHGHVHGDRVLADFGAMLLTQLRPVDCIARYGGEEFTLLLTDAAISDATAVLARLHQAWALLQPTVTFSAGLAACRSNRTNHDSFVAADTALYRAKRIGRNTDQVAP